MAKVNSGLCDTTPFNTVIRVLESFSPKMNDKRKLIKLSNHANTGITVYDTLHLKQRQVRNPQTHLVNYSSQGLRKYSSRQGDLGEFSSYGCTVASCKSLTCPGGFNKDVTSDYLACKFWSYIFFNSREICLHRYTVFPFKTFFPNHWSCSHIMT